MSKTIDIIRKSITASVAGAIAIGAAGAASAQDYRQPTGGGIGSVVSCDAPGGRQAAGAVIGALLGAALGNNIARGDDRGAGRIVGALGGAAAGSYLGCKQQRDRVVGETAYGYDNRGYAPTSYQPVYQRPYDRSAAGSYVATANVNVRSAPEWNAQRIGGLSAGQSFRAVGRDGAWMVVSNGSGVGYVASDYTRPIGRYQAVSYGY